MSLLLLFVCFFVYVLASIWSVVNIIYIYIYIYAITRIFKNKNMFLTETNKLGLTCQRRREAHL